jgi:2-keto-3-deoxy-L-rhamnonate aldolase RhmA
VPTRQVDVVSPKGELWARARPSQGGGAFGPAQRRTCRGFRYALSRYDVAVDTDQRPDLRSVLRGRQAVVATFVLLPRIEIVELAATAGFAAVVIDLEHSPITISDLPALAAAARGAGIYAIARVANNIAQTIGQALDAGVDGVMVPHVSSTAEARAVVEAGRYAPTGDRSINPFTRGNYYRLGVAQTTEDVNRRVALIAMLEGADSLAQLDEICAVDELDALFIGPVDLAASLGLSGNSEHPTVVSAVRGTLARIHSSTRASGVYASTPEAGAVGCHSGHLSSLSRGTYRSSWRPYAKLGKL